jgi:hypothetical protein
MCSPLKIFQKLGAWDDFCGATPEMVDTAGK